MFAGEQHPGGDQGDAVEADGDDPGVAGDGSSSGAHRDAAPQSDSQQGSGRPAGRPQPRRGARPLRPANMVHTRAAAQELLRQRDRHPGGETRN